MRKRLLNAVPTQLEHGKVPPHAVDLEEAVIGAIMLEKSAMDDVAMILKPEHFYRNENKLIYEAALALYNESSPIDMLTVANKLRSTGNLDQVGGTYHISRLTDRVASSANIEYHARIVEQKFMQRELIRISGQSYMEAFEDTADPMELIGKATDELGKVVSSSLRTRAVSNKELIEKIRLVAMQAKDNRGLTGVPTGFKTYDEKYGGRHPSDLCIIAGRPSMGKTAEMLSEVRNAVKAGKKVIVYSLEMSAEQLMTRLVSMETGIHSEKLRNGNMTSYDWDNFDVAKSLETSNLTIIDDMYDWRSIRAHARSHAAKYGLDAIYVDYLQLIENPSDGRRNREEEIATVSRGLKKLAKDLRVPVVALSQLSRKVEERGGSKKPILADLRESGAIEQDADIVIFIYRPEYYEYYEGENGVDLRGKVFLIIAKYRNGALGNIMLDYIKERTLFKDTDQRTQGDITIKFPKQGRKAQGNGQTGTKSNGSTGPTGGDTSDDGDDLPF